VITDLVSEMRGVVNDAIGDGDANGYFAAMYLGVTAAVEEGLSSGTFANPDRLSKLTITFARRYLDALELHRSGQHPTQSWVVAFDAAQTWRPTVLQHLLLGMNAHINLDLGVACAQVAPGPSITELRGDFLEINQLLAGLVQSVQDRLNRVSPLYRFVDDIGGDADRAVVNFSIARARHEAWRFANLLAPLQDDDRQARLLEQDTAVARLARGVLRPGPIASTGLLAVRLTENRNRSEITRLLAPPRTTDPSAG
jgi:hypothetical protein